MKQLILAFLLFSIWACHTEKTKPRVIVLSDINNIGGDPDDKQSMAHLLMYANEVDIVGIIPDLWTGRGVEATLECVDAYEQDYNNPQYNFQKQKYPTPDHLRELICRNRDEAIQRIIDQATRDTDDPVHALVWGNMNTIKDALLQAPEIASNIHLYTIATHRMAENEDALKNSHDSLPFGLRRNWNHSGRDEIFNDKRFAKLWWLENDWAYNGMFEGQAPYTFLDEIKNYGALGHYIWNEVQAFEWAHYFRAGDTPTLLYLLEPGIDINNPATSTWVGKFTKPYPEERPNYWIDDAAISSWNYAEPENSWTNASQAYDNRVQSLMNKRDEWYSAYLEKMKSLYNIQ